MSKTPIELIADAITFQKSYSRPGMEHMTPDMVLVPEQCMCLIIGDKAYHVTVEEMPA